MAVALTAQVLPHAGAAIAYKTTTDGLAASGNTAPCGPGLGLLFQNRSGGSLTLTINVRSDASFDGLPIAGTASNGTRSLAVANNADAVIPLVAADYADPSTGLATFGFSGTPTSSNVACVAISP